MSLSDDPTSPTEKIQTSTRQEPRKTLQEYRFLDSEETGMSLSNVPIPSQKSTTQEEPRECPQDSSFLQSKEIEMRFSGISPMNTDEEAFKSLHCSFSENPIYLESNLFNGNQSNFSLDYEWNMNSQRNTGHKMIPKPRFVKNSTYNNNNNGQAYLSVEASNNSSGYGTNITDSFGSGSLFSGVTSVGMMTNTQNINPPNFQSVSATSSSLSHQQQQFQQMQLKQQKQRFISHDAFGQNHVASDMVNPSEYIHSQTPEQFQLSQFQNQYQNNAEDRHASSQILHVTSQSDMCTSDPQNSQQIQQMLHLQSMASDSISSSSNLPVGVRSESGMRHWQSQSHQQQQFQLQPNQFQQHGVSTEPHWTIKKVLTKSDAAFGGGRLFLEKKSFEEHIRKHLPEEDSQKIVSSKPGIMVKVYDHDTDTTHNLRLAFLTCYVLMGGWWKKFVKRRDLKEGDKIALFWECSTYKLHFRVLSRAIPKAPAEKKKLSIQ